jgi:hypothetical protein
MSELFLLILGGSSFVFLAYTVVSWVRPHKESRAFSMALVMFLIVTLAAYFLLVTYVVHLPRLR